MIGRDPVVLCDSAHNEAGLRAVFEKIGQLPHARLHIVTGSVNDKDLDKALPLYPQAARYYFAKANIPRGLDAGELRDKAALIAEVWYLDTEANGPISKVLGGCGIRYQKDYQLADSIYWLYPTHPIFNEPNKVIPLLHYDR